MKKQTLNWNKIAVCTLMLFFGVALQTHAGGGGRGGGGGGGGFGGGGGGGRGGGGGGGGGIALGGFGAGAAGGGGGAAGGGGGANTTSSYTQHGQVGQARISVDPDTHQLLIVADETTLAQIKAMVAQLDVPKPQLLIKAVFLETAANTALDYGVQGNYTGFNNAFKQLTGYITNYTVINPGTSSAATAITGITPVYSSTTAATTFGVPAGLAGVAGSGGVVNLLGNDFNVTIQALAAKGKSTVLSRPSILVRDQQPGQIVVGQEIYLPSGVTYTTAGTGGTTIPQINGSYQNVGIILNVTPFIQSDKQVQMILTPQITEIDSSTPGQVISYGSGLLGSSPVYAPNLLIRSANTVVITPNGQTVVIGGLISNAKSSGESKIPILGDIPILGNLFKASTRSGVKQELEIFVTPHIIPDSLKSLAMANPDAVGNYIPESNSEKDLNQFLDKAPAKKN